MAEPSKTTIDWLRFRTRTEPRQALEALRPMFGTLGDSLKLRPLQRGMMGFEQASQIVVDDLVLGRMDYGGVSQRGWVRVDLPGGGCEWVTAWHDMEVAELPDAQIRRLDIALTTWGGEVSHERVVDAHRAGAFTTNGRPPVLQTIESSDPYAGRTCYVGKREKSDKFMRCYEKGWQLLAGLPSSLDRAHVTSVEGVAPADIYRCEVELKAVSREIPWDVISQRDSYFAGAYPFCAQVLPGVEADILHRGPDRAPTRALAIALENARVQFGPTLYTALAACGGDIHAVWDKVVGRSHNQALLEAGVLLVDHA
jgi:DNA relaxase NicK